MVCRSPSYPGPGSRFWLRAEHGACRRTGRPRVASEVAVEMTVEGGFGRWPRPDRFLRICHFHDSEIHFCTSIHRASWGTVPRPTSGWFVATTSAKPAAFKARQPSWAPSYRRNSPTLAGGNGLPSRTTWTFSVPSRSRKTAGPSAILLGLGRHRLPFGLVYLEVGMGDEQVPDDRLERLAVGDRKSTRLNS